MGIWEGIKRASKALAGDRPGKYAAGGRTIECEHCEQNRFIRGSAQLNTAGMSFLGLDWANQSAATLMCNNCGRIHWYGVEPNRID